jgi:hypothetical protein
MSNERKAAFRVCNAWRGCWYRINTQCLLVPAMSRFFMFRRWRSLQILRLALIASSSARNHNSIHFLELPLLIHPSLPAVVFTSRKTAYALSFSNCWRYFSKSKLGWSGSRMTVEAQNASARVPKLVSCFSFSPTIVQPRFWVYSTMFHLHLLAIIALT